MSSTSLKAALFRLLGKERDAVIVSFCTGPEELCRAMVEEVRSLEPERRHYAVSLHAPVNIEGVESLVLQPGSPLTLARQVHARFRHLRVGLAPLLLSGDPATRWLRLAAALCFPRKLLAYNPSLERHHLRLRTALASLLFLRGVPLDRIWLRPSGWPGRADRSVYPATCTRLRGRPFSSARRRVAVLTPYPPYPLSHGGAVRMYALLQQTAAEFDTVLCTFADPAQHAELTPLLDYCAELILFPLPRYREPRWASLTPPDAAEFDIPFVHRTLCELKAELQWELLQVEYTQLAAYPGDILVEHDVTFDLYRQIAQQKTTMMHRWNFWRWLRFETRAARRYRRVIVMSEKDRALLPGVPTVVIPNGVDTGRFAPTPECGSDELLFVGSFRHFPNIAAYRFFVEQVWPHIRAARPAARLTVIAGPDPSLYWRHHTGSLAPPELDGVTTHGFIADVRPYYAAANVVLVPTTVSAGTNLKVLEAMAAQRAIVSTSSGCAGLGLTPEHHVLVADTPSDFAAAILRLLQDPVARATLARSGREHVEKHFDWKHLGALQGQLWRELLASHS